MARCRGVRACLDIFRQGKVYEVVLSTGTNLTPVGIVREGGILKFRLFPGRSMEELEAMGGRGRVVIQIIGDTETLVKLALNMTVGRGIDEVEGIRVIKGVPGLIGNVECTTDIVRDELGTSKVLACVFSPIECLGNVMVARPISRADLYLLEMGIWVTRLLAALRLGASEEAVENLRLVICTDYRIYKRLGGDSEVAEYIVRLVRDNTKT